MDKMANVVMIKTALSLSPFVVAVSGLKQVNFKFYIEDVECTCAELKFHRLPDDFPPQGHDYILSKELTNNTG